MAARRDADVSPPSALDQPDPAGLEDPQPPHAEVVSTDPTPLEGTPAVQADLSVEENAIRRWWVSTAEGDARAALAKRREYGSMDLEMQGLATAMLLGIPQGVGAEATVLWYIQGKLSRAIAAYQRGGEPSYDTLLDISTYSMMARRMREAGQW